MRAWTLLLESTVFLAVMLPLVGALLVLAVSPIGRDAVRRTAVTNALLTFSVVGLMVANYDPQRINPETGRPQLMQMRTSLRWLAELRPTEVEQREAAESTGQREQWMTVGPDVRLALGVDGISLWLIALTALLSLCVIVSGPSADANRPEGDSALVLTLQASLTGLFAAEDVVLFAVCLEFTLLPMSFLIGLCGGPERRRAARRFFLINLLAGLLILVGLASLVISHSWMRSGQITNRPPLLFQITPLIRQIQAMVRRDEVALQYWNAVGSGIFWLLLAGVLLKAAVFPLHTWFRAVFRQGPPAAGVLISGVLLNVSGYICLRFLLPLFPEQCSAVAGLVCFLAITSVLYGAVAALGQGDFASVAVYWSISQLGLCLLGLFTLTTIGMTGALLQLLSHGLTIAAIVLLLAALRRRDLNSGPDHSLLQRSPRLRTLFLATVPAAMGVPGFGGFVGQWLILTAAVSLELLSTLWCLVGLLIAAAALLGLTHRVVFGHRFVLAPTDGDCVAPPDLLSRELAAVVPILVILVWIGMWPQLFLDRMQPSINRVAMNYERPMPIDAAPPADSQPADPPAHP